MRNGEQAITKKEQQHPLQLLELLELIGVSDIGWRAEECCTSGNRWSCKDQRYCPKIKDLEYNYRFRSYHQQISNVHA